MDRYQVRKLSLDEKHHLTKVLGSAMKDVYQVVGYISRSSPSSVYIVRATEDDRLYALKMTECFDESGAIEAFREELELKKLDHPYVCGYKEFFITFDKQASSVFINIITPYFPDGNLHTFIKRYQDRKEAMTENLVKTILGEILEGLVYIHECGFVHRNIKPSNVFQRKGGAMILGDLGVSTLMGDLRTNTRQTFLGTVFMAPEIGQQAHDEKSDLYSLGGVLLNMLTTSKLSEHEFYNKLGEIKEAPEELNHLLELISDIYSKTMLNTVQTLLRHKHSVRPHILEFIKAGFIQECMAQVDSSQLEKRSRKEESRNSKSLDSSQIDETSQKVETKISKVDSSQIDETSQKVETKISKDHLLDNRDDVHKVLDYIADFLDDETFLADGFSALADILRDNDKAHEVIDQKARNMISLAMWDNLYNKDIQVAGCYILSNLVVFSNPDDDVFSQDVITLIHKIMASFEYDPEVQLAAADLILALSADEKAAKTIVQLGGIQDMLIAMRHARYHATLNAVCCLALWSLTVDNENLKVACKENAVKDVCLALGTHKVSPYVCEAAVAALISLLMDDSSYDVFTELGCTGNMLTAITLHKKNAKVVKNGCNVLATVVEAREECAYEFLSNNKEEGSSPTGLSIIMETYRVHRDNTDVVESIVRLLLELSNYDEICLDLKAENVATELIEISRKYTANKEIMGPVLEALDRLGAGSVTAKSS